MRRQRCGEASCSCSFALDDGEVLDSGLDRLSPAGVADNHRTGAPASRDARRRSFSIVYVFGSLIFPLPILAARDLIRLVYCAEPYFGHIATDCTLGSSIP